MKPTQSFQEAGDWGCETEVVLRGQGVKQSPKLRRPLLLVASAQAAVSPSRDLGALPQRVSSDSDDLAYE